MNRVPHSSHNLSLLNRGAVNTVRGWCDQNGTGFTFHVRDVYGYGNCMPLEWETHGDSPFEGMQMARPDQPR